MRVGTRLENIPKFARRLPKDYQCWQKMAKVDKSWQKMAKVAKGWQKIPKVVHDYTMTWWHDDMMTSWQAYKTWWLHERTQNYLFNLVRIWISQLHLTCIEWNDQPGRSCNGKLGVHLVSNKCWVYRCLSGLPGWDPHLGPVPLTNFLSSLLERVCPKGQTFPRPKFWTYSILGYISIYTFKIYFINAHLIRFQRRSTENAGLVSIKTVSCSTSSFASFFAYFSIILLIKIVPSFHGVPTDLLLCIV